MEEDVNMGAQTKNSDSHLNYVTDSASTIKKSLKKTMSHEDEDDFDCQIDEMALMNEPLQLISRGKAMRIDS